MIRIFLTLFVFLACISKPDECFGDIYFKLSDSSPNSPKFRQKFMGSYGVNAAIEPKLTSKDRPLQEQLLPYISKNPEKAIEIILLSLDSDTNPAFYNILGNLNYQVGNYAESEKYLKISLESFPTLRRSWRTLALCYVQQNKLNLAISPLIKVIQLGGGDAQSYGLLGYSYLNDGKFESSLSAYRMARMFEPDSFDFKRGQALCLLNTFQTKAAIALFDELLSDHPEEMSFWTAQASAYIEIEDFGKAIANLQTLEDLGMANWASLNLLGDLYLNDKLPNLALAKYSSAIKMDPNQTTEGYVRPLANLVQKKYYKEASILLKIINPIVDGKTNQDQARILRNSSAQIEMNIGSPEKAFSILEKAIQEDPLDGSSLLLLGQFYADKKDFYQAEFYLERATSLKEHEADALIALGQLKLAQSDLQEALTYLEKSYQLSPNQNLNKFINSIKNALTE